MKIILASKSPRRKEILGMITKEFEVMVSDEDEILDENLTLFEQAKMLAYVKAKNVYDKTEGERIIIGSDTMVVDKGGKIYGKPKDRQDAIEILTRLQNTSHKVITSIAVIIHKDNEYIEHIDYDISDVYIAKMDSQEIINWIDTGEAYDKAGAYAVQGSFAKHIEKIDGNFWTVMGLPVHKVYNILKKYI